MLRLFAGKIRYGSYLVFFCFLFVFVALCLSPSLVSLLVYHWYFVLVFCWTCDVSSSCIYCSGCACSYFIVLLLFLSVLFLYFFPLFCFLFFLFFFLQNAPKLQENGLWGGSLQRPKDKTRGPRAYSSSCWVLFFYFLFLDDCCWSVSYFSYYSFCPLGSGLHLLLCSSSLSYLLLSFSLFFCCVLYNMVLVLISTLSSLVLSFCFFVSSTSSPLSGSASS